MENEYCFCRMLSVGLLSVCVYVSLSLTSILSAASNSCSLNLKSLGPEHIIWWNINIC